MALEERTRNASRNIIWGGINRIVLMLFPFIIRTIFIYTIGLSYLGLNSLFASVLQMLSLADLGFGTAVVYSLYKPLADNNTDLVCAIMAFLKKIYLFVGVFILILGSIVSFFLPRLIHGEVPQDINIYVIYFIFLINTVISYFFAGYKAALLTANQREDLRNKVYILTSIGQYALQSVALVLFKNYYIYIIILPLSTLAVNWMNAYLSRKYYPEYFAKGKLSSDIYKPMMKQVGGLLISRLSGISKNAVANIMISSFIGLVSLAIYSNYMYIETSVHGLLTIVGASILAGVGNSIVKDSTDKNYDDFKKFNFLYMWIVGWCFCCFVNLFQPFISLWVGRESTMDFTSVVLLCLVFYFTAAGDMRNTYINATGIWWQNRWRPIVEAIVNIVLCLVLVRRFQITGILCTLLATTVLINMWFGSTVLYSEYFKTQKFSEFILSHIKYFVVTAIITTVTYICCSIIKADQLIGLALRFMICLVVPNVFYVIVYHKRKEFLDSKALVLGFIRRRH